MKGILSALFIILFLARVSFAQTVAINGKVISADGKPIPNANILAKPQGEKLQMAFAFTDEKGDYKLATETGGNYEITVSYIGYVAQTITITPTTAGAAIVKNFTLQESANQLNEVVVNATIPIIVKPDTLIYDAGSFANGDERKLKDLLEKMPGIQVSDEGRVTVRGKQVNKLMIEGKNFFNGPKLGINNIPADVVSKIEVYENHNEIRYLKGLEDDDVTAMNIKLKDADKGFAFGDLEASGGVSERYALQPKVFYYTKNKQVSLITDFNNTGTKSFGIADYLAFESGNGKPKDFSYPDNDLTRFLLSRNYQSNTQQFAAGNYRQALSDKTDLNTYFIFSRNRTGTRAELRNEFPGFVENRITREQLNGTFLTGKVSLDHRSSEHASMLLDTYVTLRDNTAIGTINSNNQISNQDKVRGISLNQNLNYSRKLSSTHTGMITASLQYNDDDLVNRLQSDEPLLPGIIPVVADSTYNLLLQKRMGLVGGAFEIKDYWMLSPSHHIYLSAGTNVYENMRFTEDQQLLSNGTVNSFSDSGFGNDLSYVQSDIYAGLEYKFRTGVFTFKPSVFHHLYKWLGTSKSVVQPALLVKAEISKNKSAEFRYDLKSGIPDASLLLSGLTVNNFTLVTQGQPDLQNELYHQASMNYRMFDFSSFSFFNINALYRQKIEQAKEFTQITAINQLTNYVMFYRPETDLNLNADARRRFGPIEYSLEAGYGYRNFFQFVNGNLQKNVTNSISGGLGLRTMFKNAPNISAAYHIDRNQYQFANNESHFTEHQLKTGLQWHVLKVLSIHGDYVKSWYNSNTFDNLDATLHYQTKNSAWGYSLVGTNLLDNKYRRSNSFSAIYITDSRVFLLPRMILAKLTYKL
ncbi:MAG: TonB-dependent receptor [Pedobacter sp.]|nr:MAG: TonB-dependent receptor [Pedobacter sp.]